MSESYKLVPYLQLLSKLPSSSYLFKVINLPNLTQEDIIQAIESVPNFRVIESKDGKSSKVENIKNIRDFGKNNQALPFHLDGGYYIQVPRYVVMYCVRSSTKDGRTFFTKSRYVVNALLKKYELTFLESMNIVWISIHRKQYRKPLINKVTGGYQLNWYSGCLYIEPDINKLPEHHRTSLTYNISKLANDIEILLEEGMWIKHQWSEGDLVIFNNQLLLHGREAYLDDEKDRLLYRIWFDSHAFDDTITS